MHKQSTFLFFLFLQLFYASLLGSSFKVYVCYFHQILDLSDNNTMKSEPNISLAVSSSFFHFFVPSALAFLQLNQPCLKLSPYISF